MRCSPDVVSLIKYKLTSNQMLIWQHTCFNMWIKARCTLADSVLVHLMFQHEIKSDLNPRIDGLFYVLAGEALRFGPRELCLITGLRFGKWDVEVPSFDSKFKDRKNFRPIAIRPNELEVEVEAEWWIESVAFIEQQEKESLRQSVRGKGILIWDPVFEEKETRTNADSQKLDMILDMMKHYFSSKRKCSSEEDEPTQPPNDHDEVEGMVFRNDNIIA
ncbi:hypothetical protein L1987_72059 [Smallanthus sonchifolius]|uniref:Uncharacterized protein n=1 Tax=Smallanthus sonchifolius TaxID=185202 RepID=A0ACB9AU65_9ASTR|nr:hypothetical protein L1987_72059 [Smallanthus sonchifolius]